MIETTSCCKKNGQSYKLYSNCTPKVHPQISKINLMCTPKARERESCWLGQCLLFPQVLRLLSLIGLAGLGYVPQPQVQFILFSFRKKLGHSPCR